MIFAPGLFENPYTLEKDYKEEGTGIPALKIASGSFIPALNNTESGTGGQISLFQSVINLW
jgi:hypothetical protein